MLGLTTTDVTAFLAGFLISILLWITFRILQGWWKRQERLVGFLLVPDGGKLPLRCTRDDPRVRIAGKQLLTTGTVVVRFEGGYPVYMEA